MATQVLVPTVSLKCCVALSMFSPFLTCISSSEKWKELNELIAVLWWLLSLGQGPDTAGDRSGAETTVGVPAAGWGGCPHPFWMAALGSRLLRTQIMNRVKRKKKAAVAKHMR